MLSPEKKDLQFALKWLKENNKSSFIMEALVNKIKESETPKWNWHLRGDSNYV